MTSYHEHHNAGTLDAENLKAARMLILEHKSWVVEYLADHGAKTMLQKRCEVNQQDYHEVMAGHRPSFGSEDDTMSQSSRVRSSSYKSQSQHLSSLSTDPSSLGNGDEAQVLWIAPSGAPACATTADAAHLPQSDNLVRTNLVREYLKISMKPISGGKRVKCNGRPLLSFGWTSLDWASSDKDLKFGKPRSNTFYVVDGIPGTNAEIVFGDGDVEGSPVSFSGSTSFPTLNSPTL